MLDENVNVLQTVIQLRRGTEEQWNLVKDTFIPREGEPCTTIYDDGRDALVKIGDGKHTWGQLGYTRDTFFATVSYSESGEITSDKTYEEVLKAVKQNKYVGVKIRGKNTDLEGQDYLLPFAGTFELEDEGSTMVSFVLNGMYCIFSPNGDVYCDKLDYMATNDMLNYNFDADNKSIINLKDDNDLTSAVTRRYTDNSTPTFIYLEEQDGAIKSKVTDLDTLKTALMSQTDGYTQTSNPLYKAIKCYAVLNGNCYDLVYSSQENAQEAGKKSIIKRTFYAITTDGLNKLSVVVDENQTDENKKVVWTKEVQQKPVIVNFTVTDPSILSCTADKTYEEVDAAYKSGIPVYGRVALRNQRRFLTLSYSKGTTYYFTGIASYGNSTMSIFYSNTGCEAALGITMWANRKDEDITWDANTFRIANVGSPTEATDAATKGYVDESLAAKTEQFVVTVQDVDGVSKSDKTPAEIKAALEAGKQVVLKRISVSENNTVTDTGFLVSVVEDIASFCLIDQVFEGSAETDPVFFREWVSILSDQTAKSNISFNVPLFVISVDDSGKYTSDLNPEETVAAAQSGCGGNVFLSINSGLYSGIFYYGDNKELHFYFPDYVNNKIYDLKWNEDDAPSTYTFNEMRLGGGAVNEPLTVIISKDSSTEKYVADKTYEEIVAAIKSGRNVRCVDGALWEYYSSYYTYRDADRKVVFVVELPSGENEKELFQIMILTYVITEDNEVITSWGNLSIPYGLIDTAGSNQILKTDENKAMKYVDADKYLVKQPTTGESGLFLSNNGSGYRQEWANPLTVGNSDFVVIKSSTPNSTKKFRITVDDAGVISATEVT